MLKIRTFLFALLGVSPLLFLSWQLPNQATVLPTNNNESATLSGYPTPIAQASPASTFAPSKGAAGTPSGGGTTGSGGTIFTGPSKGSAGTPSGNIFPSPSGPDPFPGFNFNINVNPAVGASPSVSLSVGPDGGLIITLTPAATQAVNTAAASILSAAAAGDVQATVITLAVGGPQAQAAVAQLTSALSAAGAPPGLVAALLENLAGLLSGTDVSTTPSFPSAKLPQAQLVAGTKDLKASLTIAQTNTAPTVNINKLNNAINAYNQIVLESSPVVLQKLGQDKDFLAIGQTLKTLRAAIQ